MYPVGLKGAKIYLFLDVQMAFEIMYWLLKNGQNTQKSMKFTA